MEQSLKIALEALKEIEEGFRLSVHGNPHCYHIAKKAIEDIEKSKTNEMQGR